MPKLKILFGALFLAVACAAGGYWIGRKQAEMAWEHTYYLQLRNDVSGMIKSVDHLSRSDSDAAVQVLEKKINLAVLLAGPNEYHPRPLKDEQKEILLLVASHRKTHPFSDPNHPGINKMVQTALAPFQ